MRIERYSSVALTLLVGGLILAGILTVGGPGKGRAERRDETRFNDLLALGEYVRCLADTYGKTLPETLQPATTCRGNFRYVDPYNGQPYFYKKTTETAFTICAEFEDISWINETIFAAQLDPDTGCKQFTYVRI